MYKKFILAIMTVVFSSVLANAGGVTNIKEIVNRSSKVVRITTYESKNAVETGFKFKGSPRIAAGETWRGDVWIPWADTKEQFASHMMKIEIITPRPTERTDVVEIFLGYQSGDCVRAGFAKTEMMRGDAFVYYPGASGYNAEAPRVEGEWSAGGERRVIFYDKPDGSGGFKFEKFER